MAASTLACQEDDLPVVASGRYTEIATVRDEPICGGTIDYSDRFLERVFAEIGSSPPDRIFVRYEWLEPLVNDPASTGGPRARFEGDSTVITARRLLDEHEIAHAVHLQAWPKSRSALREGFAVLFDSHSIFTQAEWPADEALDPLLQDGSLDTAEYVLAWFLVSQIVLDHGMDGLRELWHAVPSNASAARTRTAYEDLFDRPIDTLLEPREAYPGGPLVERVSCYLVVCDEPVPWDGDLWRADGPFGCADDPHALGPMGVGGSTVERYHVVEIDPAARHRFTATGGEGTYLRKCGLQCDPLGTPAMPFFPDTSSERSDLGGRYRVEVLAELDELPTDAPASFEIERLAP